jgi:signal transduction histidine kinase
LPIIGLPVITARIETYWRDILASITTKLIPGLKVLADTLTGRHIFDELKQRIEQITRLTSGANGWARLVLDDNIGLPAKQNATEQLQIALLDLHRVLLEDGDNTLFKTLGSLRTNLNTMMSHILAQNKPFLDSEQIDLRLEQEDDFLVFGHGPSIYTMINNLIDNVIKRAFAGYRQGTRFCTIGLTTTTTDVVRLSITDNGRGLPAKPHFGVGLATVGQLGRHICKEWNIEPATPPYSTHAYLEFYRLRERRE